MGIQKTNVKSATRHFDIKQETEVNIKYIVVLSPTAVSTVSATAAVTLKKKKRLQI